MPVAPCPMPRTKRPMSTGTIEKPPKAIQRNGIVPRKFRSAPPEATARQPNLSVKYPMHGMMRCWARGTIAWELGLRTCFRSAASNGRGQQQRGYRPVWLEEGPSSFDGGSKIEIPGINDLVLRADVRSHPADGICTPVTMT